LSSEFWRERKRLLSKVLAPSLSVLEAFAEQSHPRAICVYSKHRHSAKDRKATKIGLAGAKGAL
jgi:hypothetical protein